MSAQNNYQEEYLESVDSNGKAPLIQLGTPYMNAFNNAYAARNARMEAYGAAMVAEAQESQQVAYAPVGVEEAKSTKAKAVKAYAKRKIVIILAMIFSLLSVAVAAISYLNILPDFTMYYGTGLAGIIEIIIGSGSISIPYVTLLASILFALISFIIGIVALCVKKKLLYFIVPLIGLILIAVSFVMFMLQASASAAIGYAVYATLGLALLATVVSIFSYKKIK